MYKIMDEMRVMRLSDDAIIPRDDGNTDYQEFLNWEQTGGIAEHPDPQPANVPQTVSRYQARAALLEAGMLADVEEYFSGLPSNSLAKLAWAEAPTVSRTSDAVADAATALGLTEEMLDELFLRAAQFI